MDMSRSVASLFAFSLVLVARDVHGQRPAQWTVDSKAAVTIGASEDDSTDALTTVVGATRLPDGKILVGDNGSFALRLFSTEGKALRVFGRKGAGPGEIEYLAKLLRCGDSIVTIDISSRRTSVFSLDAKYVRTFRFGSVQTTAGPNGARIKRSPYASTCASSMTFVHYGWEEQANIGSGAFRASVPFWISPADTTVRQQFGVFPGSERFGAFSKDGTGSTRPLPLGKQTKLAVSSERIFIGTGDRYEILVFDLTGKPLEPIRASRAVRATTTADIDRFRAIEMSGMDSARRALSEQRYATVAFPKTLPAHGALAVDASGNLWVQEYPRPTSNTVAWSVFDAQGQEIAAATLPTNLEVYEIGNDYVLGRYFDPEEAIPQVKLYVLRRGAGR